VTRIKELVTGNGPFAALGEQVYDDYWMFYLTRDMASALEVGRPYTNLAGYAVYKKRGSDILQKHSKEIAKLGEDEAAKAEEES
jgi:Restriction endonuclease EcoRV